MLIAYMAMNLQQYTAEEDKLQVELTKINDEVQALSSYSTAIADGDITGSTYSTVDSSVFSQVQAFQKNSTSIYNAQYQNAASYASQNGLTGTSASVWAQQMATAAKQKYTQACKDIVAQKEKALDQKKTALNTQLSEVEAAKKAAKEAVDKGIQDNAPKFC